MLLINSLTGPKRNKGYLVIVKFINKTSFLPLNTIFMSPKLLKLTFHLLSWQRFFYNFQYCFFHGLSFYLTMQLIPLFPELGSLINFQG